MKIAYFGIEGSYTYFAARKYFDGEVELVGSKAFRDVFEQVDSESCAYGVIPIENSLAGSVVENYDNLLRYGVRIVGEEYLRIEHCLLGTNHQDLSTNNQKIINDQSSIFKIKKVYAHPQALAQCSGFFAEHPWIEQVAWGDNASAAKYVAELNDETVAAIASRETGELYGLDVLVEGVADERVNITRFLVVEKIKNEELRMKNGDKVTLYFTVRHEVGSLVRVLGEFERMGLNLTKIESRPIKGKAFEYGFFVDGVGSDDMIFGEVRGASEIMVLGRYKEEVV